MRLPTRSSRSLLLPLLAAAPLAAPAGASASPVPDVSCVLQNAISCDVDFAATAIDATSTRLVEITNDKGLITSPSFDFSGTDAGDFSISDDGCTGVLLSPGDSCTVELQFAPTLDIHAGAYSSSGQWLIYSTGGFPLPMEGALTGEATDGGSSTPTPTPLPSSTPAATATPFVLPSTTPFVPPTPIATPFIPPITTPFIPPITTPITTPFIPPIPTVTATPTPVVTTAPTATPEVTATATPEPTASPAPTATPEPAQPRTVTPAPVASVQTASLISSAIGGGFVTSYTGGGFTATSGGFSIPESAIKSSGGGGGFGAGRTETSSGGTSDGMATVAANANGSTVVTFGLDPESQPTLNTLNVSFEPIREQAVVKVETADMFTFGAKAPHGRALATRAAAPAAKLPVCATGVPIVSACRVAFTIPRQHVGTYKAAVAITTDQGTLTVPFHLTVRPRLHVVESGAACSGDLASRALLVRSTNRATFRWGLQRVKGLGTCPATDTAAAKVHVTKPIATGSVGRGPTTLATLLPSKTVAGLSAGVYRVRVYSARRGVASTPYDAFFRIS